MDKRLIIVCSPPASGKTYVSMELAKRLNHVVYLDKDTLIPLSNVAFEVAHEPNDREGAFFEKYLRNVEYDVVLDLAYQALVYDDIVLINAPFSREIRDKDYIFALREKLKNEYKATLTIIWVSTSIEIVHQRMVKRNSPRDIYKLKDWYSYVKSQNFMIPEYLNDPNVKDDLIVFHNDDNNQFEQSMKETLDIIQGDTDSNK